MGDFIVVYLYGGDPWEKNALIGDAWRYDAFCETWMAPKYDPYNPIGVMSYDCAVRNVGEVVKLISIGARLLVLTGNSSTIMRPTMRVRKIYDYGDISDRAELTGLIGLHWFEHQMTMKKEPEVIDNMVLMY